MLFKRKKFNKDKRANYYVLTSDNTEHYVYNRTYWEIENIFSEEGYGIKKIVEL